MYCIKLKDLEKRKEYKVDFLRFNFNLGGLLLKKHSIISKQIVSGYTNTKAGLAFNSIERLVREVEFISSANGRSFLIRVEDRKKRKIKKC
jgi:hypothetical protein